jgi:hypothetical protein
MEKKIPHFLHHLLLVSSVGAIIALTAQTARILSHIGNEKWELTK